MSRYATVSWFLFLVYVIFYCSFRYFRKMVMIFSSPPFYTAHVRQPVASDPIPPQIHNNSKFFPFFKDAVCAIDGSHIHSAPPASVREAAKITKDLYHKIVCLLATLVSNLSMPLLDGRALPLMHVSMKMPPISTFQLASITLLMLVIHSATTFLFLTEVYAIILLNEAVQVSGNSTDFF